MLQVIIAGLHLDPFTFNTWAANECKFAIYHPAKKIFYPFSRSRKIVKSPGARILIKNPLKLSYSAEHAQGSWNRCAPA